MGKKIPLGNERVNVATQEIKGSEDGKREKRWFLKRQKRSQKSAR